MSVAVEMAGEVAQAAEAVVEVVSEICSLLPLG